VLEIPPEMSSKWGDSVAVQKNGKVKIRVINVSSDLTVEALLNDLKFLFDGGVRMIYKGKNLSSECHFRTVIGKESAKNEILCLVSPGRNSKPPAVAAASKGRIHGTLEPRTDQNIISSIRQAAKTLQSSTSSQFEITDQSGQLVPMSQADSTAFLTALGLHRLGRSKMDESGKDVASALTFLLEADGEWCSSFALSSWMDKVDNYGLLQLDISWCYLLLGSLDNLPDALARLNKAETVLRKQVHSNFVTLAVAQADMGNAIPPLCSVFVRLFLLQGVAFKTLNNSAEAAKRLGWARLLCQCLRSSSPSNVVNELCSTFMTDRSIVIAALRKSNGNPDEAGNLIAVGRDEDKAVAQKRRMQRRMGRCSNGSDWVNLDHVSSLATLLGMCVNNSDIDSSSDSEDDEKKQSMSSSIATGLLRLTNNNIDDSLQMYNTLGADTILQRVDELDKAGGSRKRHRKSSKGTTPVHKVQEVDLVTLVSMGVEESQARRALRATGNIDSALVWLSTLDDSEVSPGSIDTFAPNGRRSFDSEHPNSDNDTSDGATEAEELLKNELGNALGNSNNLEKEWLGIDLDDEWKLIEKYCSNNV
jgi:hypothetical protein